MNVLNFSVESKEGDSHSKVGPAKNLSSNLVGE